VCGSKCAVCMCVCVCLRVTNCSELLPGKWWTLRLWGWLWRSGCFVQAKFVKNKWLIYNWNGRWVPSCLYRPKSPIFIVSYPVMCRITILHGTFGHLSCYSVHMVLSIRSTCTAVGISVTFCVHYGSSHRPLFCLLCSLIGSRLIFAVISALIWISNVCECCSGWLRRPPSTPLLLYGTI